MLTIEQYIELRKSNSNKEIMDAFLRENPDKLPLFISVSYEKLRNMALNHFDEKWQIMTLIQRYPNGSEEILEIYPFDQTEGGHNG